MLEGLGIWAAEVQVVGAEVCQPEAATREEAELEADSVTQALVVELMAAAEAKLADRTGCLRQMQHK